MKPRSNPFLRSACLAASIVLSLGQAAHAETYFWDNNSITAGFGTAGSTWGTDAFWTTDPSGAFGVAGISGPLVTDDLNFGTSSLALAAGTIGVNGSVNAQSITFGSASGAIVLSGGTKITLGGTGNVTVNNAADTISSVIDGTAGLTKLGTGTLTLNGSAVNTFTGGLKINGGTLALNFANLSTPSATAPANLIDSGNALTLGGGTITLTGKGGTGVTSSQTFNGTTINSGLSKIQVTNGGSSATSTTAILGTLSHATGGIVNLTLGAGGMGTTISAAEKIMVSGTTGRWLGMWAFNADPTTSSARWVYVDATGQLRVNNGGTPGTNMVSVTSESTVYTVAAGTNTLGGNKSAQGLQINSGAPGTVAIGANTLTTSGILNIAAPTVAGDAWAFTRSGSGGITVGTENELVVAGAGNVTISAPIANKSGNNSSVTMVGGGTLKLDTAVSTYTGTTTVNAGTMTLGLANVLNSASGIVVNGGVLGYSTFDQSVNSVKLTGGTISGSTGTLTSAANFDLQNGTVSGILAGGVGINKTTSGTVILTGTNSYTGTTTISAGTLQIGNGADAGSITTSSSIVNDGALVFNVLAGNRSYSNAISGSGSLTQNGTGALTLSGGNSYTGVTTIGGSAGGIVVGANNALGTIAGNTTVKAGSSLGLSGSINYSTAETIVGSGQGSTAVVGSFTATQRGMVQSVSGNNTFAGAIQINAAGLTRFGTQDGAQLTLSGPITMSGVTGVQVLFRAGGTNGDFVTLKNTGNSWDSDTQIFSNNSGTGAGLRLGVSNALPTAYSVVSNPGGGSGAMLDLAGFNQEMNGLTANGNTLKISNSDNTRTSILTLNNTASKNASTGTVIQDGAGKIQVVKIGSFDQTLQTANTYTGGTLIKNGSITLQSGNDRLATTGSVTLGDATTTGKLVIGETATARNQTLAGLLTSGLGGSVVGATTSADSVLTLNIASSNSFSGTLGGAGTNENRLALTKSGAGTLSLSGSNTYSGATTISAGTLQAGSTTALSSNSAFSTADVAGATLDLDGNNNTLGSLAGGGATGGNVTLGAGTLTTGGNNSSTAYAGNISGGGGLIKTGSGAFTLSGTTNGYSGATAVNGGSLIVNSSLASSGVTVANNATLGGMGTIANSVVINSGGTLFAATATTAGTLTMGSLTLDAGSNLAYEFGGTSDVITISNSNGLTINGGALSLYTTGGISPLTTNGTYTLFNYGGTLGGATSNLSIANSQAGKAYSLNDTGSVIELVLGTASSSDWTNGTSNGLWTDNGNWSGGVPNSFGAVANFSIAGSSVAVDGAKTVGSIIFDNAAGYTLTGGGSDTITLDNGIAAGAISTTTGDHTINAPIILNGSANITPGASTTLTLRGDISGSKALSFGGAGTTILAGTNSYTTTTVSNGRLQIGDGVAASGTLGTGAISLASGTTLEFNRTGSYSASNNITGPLATLTMTNGDITLSGTKSLSVLNLAGGSPTISGTNTITTANLSGGTGTISGTNTITTLAVTGGNTGVSGATIGTANVSSSGAVTFSGTNAITTANISGGTATMSGTNTITTLAATGGNADISGTTIGTANISSSAAVTFSGTNAITTANVSGGTTTFLGTNSLTTLNLSGGTAKGGSATGFGSTATLVLTGTGTLDLNAANASFIGNVPTGVAGNTITDNGAGTGTSTVTFGQTGNSNITTAALITDGATRKVGVAFTNNNAGQAFSNADNTFSGGLTLLNTTNGTRLTISSAVTTTGSPGSITKSNFGTGAITIGQSATDKAGIYVTNATTVANEIVFNTTLGTDTPGMRIDVVGFTLSGKITANLSDALFSSRSGSTNSVSLTGKVTGAQGLMLDNSYNNIFVTLNNSSETNDYQGATTISGTKGTIILGAFNQIPNGASAGNVVNNGTLRLQGFSDTINGLSGSGTVTTTAAGASVLTLGDNNTTSSFSGTISNTTGTVGITKIGSGDQTFSNSNTYTGGTAIKNGSIILTGGNDRLLTTGSVALGDVSTSGKLVIGDATTARNQTLGGLTSTGLGGNVVGAHATNDSLLTLNIASGTNTYSGVLGGGGTNEDKLALTKSGNGTLELTNTSSYTGATTVSAGTLIIDGNISTSSLTTVNGTGILGGSGTVGDLTIAATGTHNPGNSPGIMNTGDYTMAGTLNLDLNGTTAGTGYDQVKVTGSVTLSGVLAATVGYTPVNGDLLFILLNDGTDAITTTFSGLAQGGTVSFSGFDWKISYNADSTDNTFTGTLNGNDVALMAIPEPSAALIGGLGLLALLRRRRTVQG